MFKTCDICKEKLPIAGFYKSRNSRERMCKECRKKRNRNRYTNKCPVCDKLFKAEKKSRECCSRKCSSHLKKNRVTLKCEICNTPITRPVSQFKDRTYIYCSRECQHKGWSKYFSGENSPVWDENITDEERAERRKYPEYYEWRNSIYTRDDFSCVHCKDSAGGNLNAHHIFNYMEHRKLRLDIDNGITLCEVCHKAFHDKYGYRSNNKEQIEEFLNI